MSIAQNCHKQYCTRTRFDSGVTLTLVTLTPQIDMQYCCIRQPNSRSILGSSRENVQKTTASLILSVKDFCVSFMHDFLSLIVSLYQKSGRSIMFEGRTSHLMGQEMSYV